MTKFSAVIGRHINKRSFVSMHTGPYRNQDETVIVVDSETNTPIGQVSRKEMNDQSLWTRTSFVFVQNQDEKFVVQVRSMQKEYYPGGIDLAAGGIMSPDETNELNATRELEEELGIVRKTEDMKLISQFRHNISHQWGNIYHVKID